MSNPIVPLIGQPGCQKDGTPFNSQAYLNTTWCRFYMGLPAKIGGYSWLTEVNNGEIVRSIFLLYVNLRLAVVTGSANFVFLTYLKAENREPIFEKSYDITPYELERQNLPEGSRTWQFDSMSHLDVPNPKKAESYFSERVQKNVLFALENKNVNNAEGGKEGELFFLEIPDEGAPPRLLSKRYNERVWNKDKYNGNAVFSASGGAFWVAPFLCLYGNDGNVIFWNPSFPFKGLANLGKLVRPENLLFLGKGPGEWAPVMNLNQDVSALNPIIATGPRIGKDGALYVPLWALDLVKSQNEDALVLGFTVNNPMQRFICATKIVKGVQIKGSGVPSVLFWSLESLIRGTYDISSQQFLYDTISENISIIAPGSVIEHNQVFYWIGNNRFYMFNGTVQELANPMNKEWFFNKLDINMAGKIWSIVVPKYNEIWWGFPSKDKRARGKVTDECDRVIVYNVEGDFWYDLKLDRAAGSTSPLMPYPVMSSSSNEVNSKGNNVFPLYLHERGYDAEKLKGITQSIPSSFETRPYVSEDIIGNDLSLIVSRIEPDFIIKSSNKFEYPSMNCSLTLAMNPNEFNKKILESKKKKDIVDANLKENTYNENFTVDDPRLSPEKSARIVSFKFSSNQIGASYQMGKTMVTFKPGVSRA